MNSRVLPFDTSTLMRKRNGPQPDEPDRVDVRELFRMLGRRRRLLIASFVTGCLAAFLIAHMMTPAFTGYAKVMLDPRKSQMTSGVDVVPQLQLNDQVVNSEVAVLTSNVLIEAVIDKIGVDRLKPIDPTLAKPSLIARASHAIKAILGMGSVSDVPPPADGLSPEQMHLQALNWAVRRNLKVAREGQSYVIDIKVETPNSPLSALLANTIATEYISTQLSGRRATVQSASEYLSGRVAQLRAQADAAEARVEKFRAENLLVDGGTLDAARQQLAELNNQLVSARADRIAAEARYDRLREVIDTKGLAAVSDIVTSPAIDTLSAQLMDLKRQDAVWAEHYDTKHPERMRLATEIAGVQKDLDTEVKKVIAQRKNDVDIARIREQTMLDSIKQMENRVVDLSRSTIGLRQLEGDVSTARAAYQQIMTRLTDTETQEQMQRPDAKLIEKATISTAQSSPRPKLMMAMGGVAGLVIGFGLVFFLEMTSTTFRTVTELEAESGAPVLAMLPRGPWKSPLGAWRELAQSPYGLYAERIRHLRTALLLRDGKEARRSIMMVSSVPGEGKTTTTLALARMVALAGKKVIVVDCDLRRATLYRTFGWTAENDFAGFISNKCSLSQAIHRDPDLGFDVLAASAPRPDAADELAVEWLAPMIETLKRNYDLVLVDAPAMLAVADALVVGQAVDLSLYLVRWDSTPRSVVAKGLAECNEAGLSLAGTVLTMVDPRHSPELYAEGYDYSA